MLVIRRNCFTVDLLGWSFFFAPKLVTRSCESRSPENLQTSSRSGTSQNVGMKKKGLILAAETGQKTNAKQVA